MRILNLHSRYSSGPVSGENREVEDDVALLREAGHEVVAWDVTTEADPVSKLRLGARAVWSSTAARRVRRELAGSKFDVVHVHNLFPQLSPSVIRAATQARVPVVMTLYNYRLACLPALMYRDGKVCEDCVGKTPWRGVVHRCYRDSFLASGAMFASLALHHKIGSFEGVSRFVAVSDFVRDKHIEMGIPASKIAVRANPARATERRRGSGDYLLYLGRLSPEKGFGWLMGTWKPELGRLVVAGDGPERLRIGNLRDDVSYRGTVAPADVGSLIRGARAVIVPSLSYDAGPQVIAEAYAAGVPVIASRIGGIPERVVDNQTGLLVDPGDPAALAQAISRLGDDDASARMGEHAYAFWRQRFDPTRCIAKLVSIYEDVRSTSRSRVGAERPV